MVNQNYLSMLVLAVTVSAGGCAHTEGKRTAKTKEQSPSRHVVNHEFASTTTHDQYPSGKSNYSTILMAGGEVPSVLPSPEDNNSNGISPDQLSEDAILTIAELEALAMDNNPTLTQAVAAVDQQRGEYRQSGLYPNPQIGYLNTTANQSAPKQSNGVFLSQEIVTAQKIPLAQSANSQEIKRLEWDHEAQRMRVLNDIRIRYYEVLGAQQAVEVNQELERLAREFLSTAEELFQGKTVGKSDVLQAQVLVESSRIGLAEANHRLEAAWEQLATMAGVPSLPLTSISDADTDADEIPNLDPDAQWQQILAESPQLKSAESELDHGQAVLRQAKAQAIPNVTLQVVADYDRVTQSTTASTLVALPLPIYNRNQGNIDKAMADVHADQADVERTELVLRDQLADSFRRYKTNRIQAEALQNTILPAVEENLRLTAAAYKAGEVSFRDVLSAQEAFAQSKNAKIEAFTNAQKIAVEIRGLQLTGGLNPAAIGSAIQSQSAGGQSQRALLQEVQDRATKQLLPAAQIGR